MYYYEYSNKLVLPDHPIHGMVDSHCLLNNTELLMCKFEFQ